MGSYPHQSGFRTPIETMSACLLSLPHLAASGDFPTAESRGLAISPAVVNNRDHDGDNHDERLREALPSGR